MKKGFTLIELLVVVIIVAVLTRIALPQYRRVVDKARVAEAQTMLRTLYDSSERLAAEFGAPDFSSLYADESKRDRVTIRKMDMFDQSEGGETFRFACKIISDGFKIKCKNWNYTLVTVNDKTDYIVAKDSNGDTEISLNRSTMRWGCHSLTGERGKQLCMAYDIIDLVGSEIGKYE